MIDALPSIPFTPQAWAALQTKKTQLTQLRVEVMARLKEAREQGDLSENGAYTYAKFELGSIGRQLRSINHQLEHGYVAKSPSNTQTVQFGSTVTVITEDKTMEFLLVSAFESDPAQQKLSIDSPIGQAIYGKKVGDEVAVALPRGTRTYRILRIR